MDGFAHKTLCLVACKILQSVTAAAAVLAEPVTAVTVMAECRASITLLPHVEAKEVVVVGYSIHIHKEFPQPSNQ